VILQMNSPQSNLENALTRRHFLKTTSAAGLTLIGGLGLERSAFAAGNDEIKIALVGCGGRGSGAAQQALNANGVKLVAMAEVRESQIEKSLSNLKKSHGEKVDVPKERQFVGLDAYKQAIAAADAVLLATPPGFRPTHFEEAVRQGKHVFMEKPLATDAPGIRQLLAANEEAKKKSLKVACGFQRHHVSGYVETIKRIHDGALGDILMLRVYWRGGSRGGLPKEPGETELAYQLRNWYFFTYLSGDHIVEQHCHNIDVGNWIKGTHPVRASGVGGRQVRTTKEHGQIYDHHFVEFEYADGSRMFSECSQIPHMWGNISEHAVGTKGSAELKEGDWRIKAKSTWKYDGPKVVGWQQEQLDFIDNIRHNKAQNELETSAYSTMTAIMGRMATYSGQLVEWDDAFNSKLALVPANMGEGMVPAVMPDKDGFYPVAMPGITTAL
jgi:predicted dehydrogenase